MSFDIPGLDWSGGRRVPAFQTVQQLDVYDIRGSSSDVQFAATSCAGIVNRPQPRVYLITGNDDEYWLKQVFGAIPQTLSPHKGNDALHDLLKTYRASLQGLIIYNPDLIDTVNIATTLAGQRDGIVASPTLAQELQGTYTLQILEDLRKYQWTSRLQAYHWAQQNLLEGSSSHFVAGMDPKIANGLRSFLVATRTFVYWLDSRQYLPDFSDRLLSERALLGQIYKSFAPGTLHLGWFVDEPSGVALTSQAGIVVLATDYFCNLEVWTALPLSSPLKLAPKSDLSATPVANKIYLSFTISDGDNLQFCQKRLLRLWQDSARGTLPIGWTISPLLLQAAPRMAEYYLSSVTPDDELIAGPSGAGYMFPSAWPDEHLPWFLKQTGELMQAMGLNILEVLDTDPLYRAGLPIVSRYSMTGMAFTKSSRQEAFVQALAPYGLQGLLSGAGFLLGKGSWKKVEDLPLFGNLGLAGSVDQAINLVTKAASAHHSRPLFLNLYILAWSMTPSDLKRVVERLGDQYEIVLPGTLLAMLAKTLP